MIFLLYAGIGMVFSFWFVTAGHQRLDPSSKGAAWYTRLLWLPGAILLWPILSAKILQTGEVT